MVVLRRIFLLFLLLLVFIFFVLLHLRQYYVPQYVVSFPPELYLEIPKDSHTLFLMGDVMLDRGVEMRVDQYGGGDWRFPWEFVADRLFLADVVFINHEGVMSDVGKDAGGVYSFNFPLTALDGLLFAGVDVVSLANNHSFDWGAGALCDTRRRLIAAGIGVVGAGCDYGEANAPYIHSFPDGSSVGFLGYTSFYPKGVANEEYPGVSDYSLDTMLKQIAVLREKVAVVIVSLHWGEEYQSHSNIEQQRLGRMLIDAGVDIIVGHHPHTIQEVEEYNGGWILYSLGNFIFDQYFSKETMEGLVGVVTIQGGEIVSVATEKVILNSYFQPLFESDI